MIDLRGNNTKATNQSQVSTLFRRLDEKINLENTVNWENSSIRQNPPSKNQLILNLFYQAYLSPKITMKLI
jgi:hypothetical protein